jgi:translocation and assembly module TamA
MHVYLLLFTLCISLISTYSINADEYSPDNTKQQKVINFEMIGKQKNLLKEIRHFFTVDHLTCSSSEWKLKQALDDDKKIIKKTSRAYGYYHLEIVEKITRKKDCWNIEINITEGPRVIVDSVNIHITGEANDDSNFMRLISKDIIKVGDPLQHDKYEQLKKQIEAVAAKRGYFDGKYIDKKFTVDKTNNSASIILSYSSSKRYRVGKLTIEQNALDSELLNKYINIISGQPYNEEDLISTYQGLSSSFYYTTIDLTPQIDQRQNYKVPILLKAVTSKIKTYSIGIGASTNTGPRLKASHKNKLVNSRGHSYLAELSLSPVVSNIGFSYRIPGEKPRTDFYELSSQAIHEDTDTSTSDTFNIGAAKLDLLDNEWTRRLSLQYSIDDFDVGEDNDITQLFRPLIGFSITRSNSPLRPTNGYRINATFTSAHEAILSDLSFSQATISAKYIRGFGKKIRLLTRTQLGYTETSDFEELPSNLRFFAGGDTSIRGYDYEALGPEDEAGDITGGDGLIIGSLEMDYLFTQKWGGALFVDGGNAFIDSQFDMVIGAGIGVRWQSPIGPVRLDLAFPIDEPDADNDWRLHFSLGPDL